MNNFNHMKKIFYITHSKGGSGASLFATNFAYGLAKTVGDNHKKVLFIDGNQFSDIANLFGIKAKKDILNLDLFFQKQSAPLNIKDIKKIFGQTTYQINELDVLLSPEKYHPQKKLNELYKKTLAAASQIYDYIIIDGERDNRQLLYFTIPNLKNVFVVATPDTPSIIKTKSFLNVLKRRENLTAKIGIIYNQAEKFSPKDLENILAFPIFETLPTEANAAWDNILLGVPIVENRKLAYSRKINQLVEKINSEEL